MKVKGLNGDVFRSLIEVQVTPSQSQARIQGGRTADTPCAATQGRCRAMVERRGSKDMTPIAAPDTADDEHGGGNTAGKLIR